MNTKINWDKDTIDELLRRRDIAQVGGGQERIQRQKAAGKLTARERIDILFDNGTFEEIDAFVESRTDNIGVTSKRIPGDGVIIGYGKINGKLAFASSEDFTVIGGTLGESHSKKICRIMDMAMDMRAPFISINDSGGARIEEGVVSLNGYSSIFMKNTEASGVIPQIAVILGPCAGGACYSPAICDFVFMSAKSSNMFITGPQVVKTVTGEQTTAQELGGATIHMSKSGVAHFVHEDDEACLVGVRKLLNYLPQNNCDSPSSGKSDDNDRSSLLSEIVPDTQKSPYDVKKVIGAITDSNSFLEVQAGFARNIVVGFGRLDGRVIGIVANQTSHLAGAIDIDASDKAARFIRFCDCFNIVILSLVDVSGFLPGRAQEHNGIIRHGAKLLYAYSEATVPKVSLVMRKAYGGAYIAMNSKGMGADLVYAWPIAQIAVMGAESAVEIIYKRELANATVSSKDECIERYRNSFMNPYIAASRGYINEVIFPEETRRKLVRAFEMLETKTKSTKQKKHGNIPL